MLLKNLFLSLILLLAMPVCAIEFIDVTPEEAGFSSEKLDQIQKRFDALYEDGRIPNYAIGLYSGNKRFYAKARGKTEIGVGEPVDLDTIYPFASMTKPIVSTGIMILIQEGRLSLDSRLSEFYPAFKNMFVAPNGSFESTFEEASREITIRDLLTHTAGFTYQTTVTGQGDVAKQYDDLEIFMDFQKATDDHMETLSQVPLLAHPGETFTYSISVDVLGAVIEKISGQRLNEFLKSKIFQPLGMNDSDFWVREEDRKRFAEFYQPLQSGIGDRKDGSETVGVDGSKESIDWKISKGTLFPIDDIFDSRPAHESGGAGLATTVNDYARYCAMILADGEVNGKEILTKKTLELHLSDLTPQLTSKSFSRDFGEGAAFMKFGGGYGIKYLGEPGADVGIDYYFWGGAFNTFFWIDRDNGHFGVFATNHSPPQYNISDDIEQIVDEAKL